ncbi:MAG: DUF1292 domain-containing protein [Clostridiales bacterium]|nr:DUF1292 domain-containing protein [Clostridiales bacterium]
MDKYESIPFLTDDGLEIEFYIIDHTRINGTDYLLVSDEDPDASSEDDEMLVYILKENAEEDGMNTYEMVEDDTEAAAVFKIFEQQQMNDMDGEAE